MYFAKSLAIGALAFASAVVASAGCNVTMYSNLADPADTGEELLSKVFVRWSDSTSISLASTSVDWDGTAYGAGYGPYWVYFYPDSGKYNLTTLESIVEPWNGTWLGGITSPESTSVIGDFFITSVDCYTS